MSILALGHCIGPYRIIRLIGEGGMGAVYEARQEPLNRRVAIKILQPEHSNNQDVIARFFSEARVLSFLAHPSLVQVSDFGCAPDGTAYLVMEYLHGQSLSQLLTTGDSRLSLVAALQLAWQVADVLTVAHAHGIVHRDVKPENLMLVADPVAPGGERVKVLDFGIAKLIRGSELGNVKTNTQAVMGTPMYMSPEQCSGAGAVDEKTDVYSLGCVLYQALAGRPPFLGEGMGTLIGMHLFQVPPPLAFLVPSLPTAVTGLVEQLLTKDKEQRPSMAVTADRIKQLLAKLANAESAGHSRRPVSALREAAEGSTPRVAPRGKGQPREQRPVGKTPRRRVLIGSAAGLTLAVAALTLWKLSAPQQTATSSRTGSFSAAQEGPVGVMPAAIHAEPADPRAAFSDSLSRRVEKAPAASADVRVAKMPSRTAPAPSKDADISAFFPKK